MSSLSTATSAMTGLLFCAGIIFSAPLFAATESMTDSMPMSHHHGAMMADAPPLTPIITPLAGR